MTPDAHLRDRMVQLAKLLTERTTSGRISWSSTDDESTFIYSAKRSSVTIDQHYDQEGDPFTTLSVLNERGTAVETLQSSYAPPEGFGSEYTPASWNKPLEDLYSVARSSALKIDEVLDDLMRQLDSE